MNAFRKRGEGRAFTVLELLLVVVVVFSLAAVLLPAFARPHRRVNKGVWCVNNLKQVGLAYRLWAGDNGDKYPQSYIGSPQYPLLAPLNGYSPPPTGPTCPFSYLLFSCMSNELSTPRILVCPTDARRTAATNFTTDFDNRHLSYFAGLDANPTNPNNFLSGDWNITNGRPALNGILYLNTNQNIGWTKELHNQRGNVAMGDGSVRQEINGTLNILLTKTGLATNRLLLP